MRQNLTVTPIYTIFSVQLPAASPTVQVGLAEWSCLHFFYFVIFARTRGGDHSLPRDRALDLTVRLVCRNEHLVRVVEIEGRQVDWKVMLVWASQVDRRYFRRSSKSRLPHTVQAILDSCAVRRCEYLDHRGQNSFISRGIISGCL